jgi:transposase
MFTQPAPLPGLDLPEVPPGLVVINDRCCMETRQGRRFIAIGSQLTSSYAIGDGARETMAMLDLIETGTATQLEVARAFGYSTRQVRRYQRQRENGGLAADRRPGRRPGAVGVVRLKAFAVRSVRQFKEAGISNREIARRLGVCEKAIRKLLRRMGWQPCPQAAQQPLPGLDLFREAAVPMTSVPPVIPTPLSPQEEPGAEDLPEPCPPSLDHDPANRSLDRLLACMGALDDARPLFQAGARIPHAGVLLALPALAQSGLLSVARDVYGSIGPAFYGLRSTLLVLLFMALLRIKRPEGLKEQVPAEMGKLVGLDRSPEVKTLRRKLERLAALRRAEYFGKELARLRVAQRGDTLGFLYVDGHVRVYNGKHRLPKAHVTRMRIALPATTDYWVNTQSGDPLFVVTAEANAGLVQVLPGILAQAKDLMGERHITVVFDRGGWSPKLFQELRAAGIDFLTYLKGNADPIPEEEFKLHTARLDGKKVEYKLHDGLKELLGDKLWLRQVTRLKEDGHQTQILTTLWEPAPIEIAHRMFSRWKQENFFKYMRDEYMLDALVDYNVEADDPERSVPNPERRQLDKEIVKARLDLTGLQDQLGKAAIDNPERRRPTMRGFKIAHSKLGKKIRTARNRLDALLARKASLPERVAVGQAVKGPIVKLSQERKHLTDLVKMVAYQIESDLVAMIAPHFARAEDEGRTLVQNILAAAADLEVTTDELRVKVAPLSSPHRTKVLAAICEQLNLARTIFPGTRQRMVFMVAGGAE